jgi:hypothetical protein
MAKKDHITLNKGFDLTTDFFDNTNVLIAMPTGVSSTITEITHECVAFSAIGDA